MAGRASLAQGRLVTTDRKYHPFSAYRAVPLPVLNGPIRPPTLEEAALSCTILLVDDMRHVREVLRLRLELEDGFTIVAEGSDGRQAIELASRHQPDVAIIDHSMPVLTGLEAIPQLKTVSPNTRVIMFSSSDEVRTRALRAGADAFINKSHPLEACIDEVATGCSTHRART